MSASYYHVLPHIATYYHVLPRTTTYYHVLSYKQNVVFASRFYCFTILLFYSTYSTAAADVWGWRPEMQNSIASRAATLRCRPRTTYYHVLPLTTTYYHVLPRTTTYYHVLPHTITYYHVLPRTIVQAERSFCISGSHPCMSGLLFYCFTILPFYYLTISLHIQYCRGRCLGLAARDAKKVFASRAAMSASCYLRPRITTYYHILPPTYYHVL